MTCPPWRTSNRIFEPDLTGAGPQAPQLQLDEIPVAGNTASGISSAAEAAQAGKPRSSRMSVYFTTRNWGRRRREWRWIGISAAGKFSSGGTARSQGSSSRIE